MDPLRGAKSWSNSESLANVVEEEGTLVKDISRAGLWPGKCDTKQLQEVTLIIHCRQKPEICELRRPLLMEYVPYFKESIFFLSDLKGYNSSWRVPTRKCSGVGDPYWCIAQEVPKVKGLGILYMQFDVAVSPCELAKQLEMEKLFLFTGRRNIFVTFDYLDDCNVNKRHCLWWHWDHNNNNSRKQIERIRKGLYELQHLPSMRQHLSPEKQRTFRRNIDRLRTGLWREVSDFMYLPKSVTHIFAALAKVFHKQRLFNEMASLSCAMLSAAVAGVQVQNRSCQGSCCSRVSRGDIMKKGFICGHRYDYRDLRDAAALRFLVSQQPWPLWRTGRLQAQCRPSNIDKVLLVLHCPERLESCRSRLHLLAEYGAYFPNSVFMLSEDIPWDPAVRCSGPLYRCLALQNLGRLSGLLYVRLDVAMSPCALAQRLQLSQSAWGFGNVSVESLVPFQQLQSNASAQRLRQQLYNVTVELRKRKMRGSGNAVAALQRGLWRNFDGLFYIPKVVFQTYTNLAAIFTKFGIEGDDFEHHGFTKASATMLAVSNSLTTRSVPLMNLCGNQEVSKELMDSDAFVCGRLGASTEALDDLLVPPTWHRVAAPNAAAAARCAPWRRALSRALHQHAQEVTLGLVLIPFLSVSLWRLLCRRQAKSTSSKP